MSSKCWANYMHRPEPWFCIISCDFWHFFFTIIKTWKYGDKSMQKVALCKVKGCCFWARSMHAKIKNITTSSMIAKAGVVHLSPSTLFLIARVIVSVYEYLVCVWCCSMYLLPRVMEHYIPMLISLCGILWLQKS